MRQLSKQQFSSGNNEVFTALLSNTHKTIAEVLISVKKIDCGLVLFVAIIYFIKLLHRVFK